MKIPDYVEETHIVLWPSFVNWCKNNNLVHEDDMKAHWDCFLAGATCMYLEFKKGTIT